MDAICDDREATAVKPFADASAIQEAHRELCAGDAGGPIELECATEGQSCQRAVPRVTRDDGCRFVVLQHAGLGRDRRMGERWDGHSIAHLGRCKSD